MEKMKMEMKPALEKLFIAIFIIGVSSVISYLYYIVWVKPERIRRKMRQQGMKGPPLSSFFSGNIPEINKIAFSEKKKKKKKMDSGGAITHDYCLFPHLDHWRKLYGPLFIFSLGNAPILHVSSPEMVKEISLCLSMEFGKTTFLRASLKPLFGDGIIKSNGKSWAQQRKIIAPELFINKVKGMVDLMVSSVTPLLDLWTSRVEEEGGVAEMEVYEDLRNYSADVISRACFGSSYSKGKEIFSKLRALQKSVSKPSLLAELFGCRLVPSKSNREIWRLETQVRKLILEVVRAGKASEEKNLLQAILNSTTDKAEDLIVDNCKAIYFAGHETTASTAAWCLLLLAMHPEWQNLARAEAVEVSSVALFDVHSLQKMKILTMVIQETLRLYPAGPIISREALDDMKLGNIDMPKGLGIYIPVPALHRDPTIWGSDAGVFNPKRFAHGVQGACKQLHAYVPFGAGSRICVGQHLAMVELKIVLALILSKLKFSLSTSYRHSPAQTLTLEPEFGVRLIVSKA